MFVCYYTSPLNIFIQISPSYTYNYLIMDKSNVINVLYTLHPANIVLSTLARVLGIFFYTLNFFRVWPVIKICVSCMNHFGKQL